MKLCCPAPRLAQSVHSPPVPHPGSYLVVTELVVFSLCGQTSLSCYCTHADAAANPIHPHPLQPPSQPLSTEPPNNEVKQMAISILYSLCCFTLSNHRNKPLLWLSLLLNIRLKVKLSRNYTPHPVSLTQPPSLIHSD